MNRILLVIFLTFQCGFVNAQALSFNTDGEPISRSNVFKTDSSLKKNQLYSLGIEWFVNVFNNPKFVMQMQDKDAGIIMGRCSLSVIDTLKPSLSQPIYTTAWINYIIKLSCKDGKIKYELYSFNTEAGTVVKNGAIAVTNVPNGTLTSKKKLTDYYIRTYRNLQLASGAECDLISKSIEKYFANAKYKSDW